MTVAELISTLQGLPQHYKIAIAGDLYGVDEAKTSVTILWPRNGWEEEVGKTMTAIDADWYDTVAYDPNEA